MLLLALHALALADEAAAPADALPDPRPELCVPFEADPRDPFHQPVGLTYDEVRAALDGVIQTALRCDRPAGAAGFGMTFQLSVGCDGRVASVTVADAGGAPAAYTACVAAVLEKADFPGHDMADGMPVTYPVDVAW